jgi:hypothetical protein
MAINKTNKYAFPLENGRYLQPKKGQFNTFQGAPIEAGRDGIVSSKMVKELLPKPPSYLKINPSMITRVKSEKGTLGDLTELSQVRGSKGTYNGEELTRVYFEPPASVVEVENNDGTITNHVLLEPDTTMFIETVTPQMAEAKEIEAKARIAQLSTSMQVPSNDHGINLTSLQKRLITKLVGCTNMSDEQIRSFVVSWHSVFARLNEAECQRLDEQIANLNDFSPLATEQHGHLIQYLNEAKESATQRLQSQPQEVKQQEVEAKTVETQTAEMQDLQYRIADLSRDLCLSRNCNGIDLTSLQRELITKLAGYTSMSNKEIGDLLGTYDSLFAYLNEAEYKKLSDGISKLDSSSTFTSQLFGHLDEAKESATQRLQSQAQTTQIQAKKQEVKAQVTQTQATQIEPIKQEVKTQATQTQATQIEPIKQEVKALDRITSVNKELSRLNYYNPYSVSFATLQNKLVAKLIEYTSMSDREIITFVKQDAYYLFSGLNEAEYKKLSNGINELNSSSTFLLQLKKHLNEAELSKGERVNREKAEEEAQKKLTENLNALLKKVSYLQYDMVRGAVTPLSVMAKDIAEACLTAGMKETEIIEILSKEDNPKLFNRISNNWWGSLKKKLSKEGLMDAEGKPLTAEKLKEHISSCLEEERTALRKEREEKEANNNGGRHHHSRNDEKQNNRYM